MSLEILAFSASLRKESFNTRLIRLAARSVASIEGVKVDVAPFREFEMPLYDGDTEETQGLPPGAQALKARIEKCDAIMVASPEYNFSLPGTLKNAIDWVSRARPVPIRGKTVFLMSASISQVGGIRGLWQLRIPLEGLGAFVVPEMYTLPLAQEAFTSEGELVEPKRQETLSKMIERFVMTARALKK